MKSPYGTRGALCAHYHWTWQYLHWGIRWAIVQRMLIDAPGYDMPADEKKKVDHKRLSKDNANQIADYINSLGA